MPWALDVNGFSAATDNGLAGTNGYCAELRQHGQTIWSDVSGNAIDGQIETTPANPVASAAWAAGRHADR